MANSYKPIRAKQAAQYLGVSSNTVRNWCNQGRLPYTLSAAGQRIFDKKELDKFKQEQLGNYTEPENTTTFYARSSSGDDITINTQLEKLTLEYGEPLLVFKDKASGLNDNRPGLNKLVKQLQSPGNEVTRVCVTNKDRLTRFGYNYLEMFFAHLGVEIVVLDSPETKEPYEVLMDDFMSLITSFSGKFYRVRGWKQKQLLLKKAQERVDQHVEQTL